MRRWVVILLLSLGGCEKASTVDAPAKPTSAAIPSADAAALELEPRDRSRLAGQRQIIRDALEEHARGMKLRGDASDLPALQRLIDARVFDAEQIYEHQSLAVAFGDVLAKELGLTWVMVMGPHGTDPALRGDGALVDVLARVGGPLRRGEPLDLALLGQRIEAELVRSGRAR